jgi:allophanate hydrolase
MRRELSIAALRRDYREGKRRPRDVLESVYAGLAKRGERPVFISTAPLEAALDALAAAEKNNPEGPLFGIPFAVKDNIDVEGLATTAACPQFSYDPQASAPVVQRLIDAGAIVIGKTNLDQFATGLVGTRTPFGVCASVFDERYISGGSSSGSAVAVARGDVSFALGTDTAGSGRIPAAFNDLVGVKPTRGLLSSRGVVPACRSLDCISIFSGDLEDARLLLEIAQGYDPADPFSRRAPTVPGPRARLRLGVPNAGSREFFGDIESAALFDAAVARYEAYAELEPIDLGPFREAAELLYQGPWVAERLAAVGSFFERQPDAVHPVLRGILEGAKRFTARETFEASYRLEALRRVSSEVFERIDALLLPTAPTHYAIAEVLAEPILLNSRLGTYTNFVNLLDLSGLAVPAGFRGNGLPFGVTLLAPAFHDFNLLTLASRVSEGAAAASAGPGAGRVWLAVAGAHLSGQPLNAELVNRGARLVKTSETAPEYRLFALPTTPPKPGLVHAPGNGQAIEIEIWELTEGEFGSFVAAIPAPMTIGTTRLRDGSSVKGFSCEPHALEGATEISRYGGWRAYLSRSH